MALCADIVPPGLTRRARRGDRRGPRTTRDWQQTPGDIGHVYFIRALAEAGRSDVLHRVYAREGQGSYGGILPRA